MIKWFQANCNKNACTCWFDSFKKWDWKECCIKHDYMYINNKLHNRTKWEVDKELFKCVRKKTCLLFASVMWLGNATFSWVAWNMYKNDVKELQRCRMCGKDTVSSLCARCLEEMR